MRIAIENISKIKKKLILVIILLIMAALYIYNTQNYVIIRFDELGALTKNMSVYYNGFKIGKIVHIAPDDDFKHILVKVNLTAKKLILPQNTTAKVENFPNGELYLQFIYPSSPSLKTIKRGDRIEGTAPYSIEQFMLGQNISGVSDIVSLHVIQALNATEIANQEMTAFFKNTSKLIEGNSEEINASVNNAAAMTKSLAQMAENLNLATKKLNNALDETIIKDSALNIKDSTSNIKDTTGNISKATKDLDKTMKTIDDTVSEMNASAKNLNSMTSGLNETLGKRLGGMRILFGKPVKPKNTCTNVCN